MTDEILKENALRLSRLHAPFDPVSGEGAPGPRTKVMLTGLPQPTLWLPDTMLSDPIIYEVRHAPCVTPGLQERFDRVRCRHDFPYWAATHVYIKRKGGGEDCLFKLTYPQRKFVAALEECRLRGRPIRLVLLKARQWGGSTASQLYMAWLQLVHECGLNSLIIAHQGTASDEIKDMFDRMIRRYPARMLHDLGEKYSDNEKKIITVGRSGATFRVPQRNCKIKIGTAERPDSCRGGDYNLVHLSEVGLWKKTLGKKPEDIVRAACAGVVYTPMSMIVYESTANGVGNFFHREYVDARDNRRSQFRALFIPWYDIEHNTLPVTGDTVEYLGAPPAAPGASPLETFAAWLYANRDSAAEPSCREESGRYLWWLWQRGATLEGINWYITERAKHSSHGSMAAECPSDDTEAFVNSGASVFDKYKVEAMRGACRAPRYTGEVTGRTDVPLQRLEDREVLHDLHFTPDRQGRLAVWSLPDNSTGAAAVDNRYLVVVDVGGRSDKSDWSVIAVFDRLMMIDGGRPGIAAQWYGHCDMDILAWKAAQIAAFYDNALLVIESNTLETRDRDRWVDGDQSQFILNRIKDVYPNLYYRRQPPEDIRQGVARKYGFHTNVSTKPMIISTLVKAVRDHMYTERDERCLNELLVYERRPNGSFGAITGEHDDLLMTRAIGLHVCFHEMEPPRLAGERPPMSISPKVYGEVSF